MTTAESWGRFPRSTPGRTEELRENAVLPSDDLLLPYGLGRSYGDSCLNNGHTLLRTRGLRRIHAFDREEGLLTCDAGISLEEILQTIVPAGWFLPVTPGTKFVTLGGCIANDVHGKNHHRAGTFGRHVVWLQLLRSDGALYTCSSSGNEALFRATIGGLGLTGLITRAQIRLRPLSSPFVLMQQRPFDGLAEFLLLANEADRTHESTVAWFDSRSGSRSRGIFMAGNHETAERHAETIPYRRRRMLHLPVAVLSPLLNKVTVGLFNAAYYRLHARARELRAGFEEFYYPLDAVARWNRIYGRKGFLQYQFVIPSAAGLGPVGEILDRAAASRLASFLTVIKRFGELESPGLLSFPRPGITVTLDFAIGSSEGLFTMLNRFDDIVAEARGAVYPAKDARMSSLRFRDFYPRLAEFIPHVDPRFSSTFWRRVTS